MEKHDKIDLEMDDELRRKEQELAAHNDETGDGKVGIDDLKAQLNRIEAQLDLQDAQNRKIMRNQKIRMALTIILAVLLAGAVAFMWYRIDVAYQNILTSCNEVNEIAATLNDSLDTIDTDQLNKMMQDLPLVTEQLKAIDVEALNDVLNRLPAMMDTVTGLQNQINSIADTFSGLKGLGGLLTGGN